MTSIRKSLPAMAKLLTSFAVGVLSPLIGFGLWLMAWVLLILGLLLFTACASSQHLVVIESDTPLQLAEDTPAKVAYNAAPAGQPENWVIMPNPVILPAGKYVISRRAVPATSPASVAPALTGP